MARLESHSGRAWQRFRARERRALMVSDWLRALFIHFEVPPAILQPQVPLPLDLREGRAYVSLVAFTMRGLRLAPGGRLGAWLLAPAATHGLLNVRTYVRGHGERAIYFMTEWIPNWLSTVVGPRTYGLPYRLGRLDYHHRHESGEVSGTVVPARNPGRLRYRARVGPTFGPCVPGSLGEFLLERYTAFTCARGRLRLFRIWHDPWPQTAASAVIEDDTALPSTGPWHAAARLAGAHYSPGAEGVLIGRPRRVTRATISSGSSARRG